jgi:6-phosphogluconolactonase
MKTEVLADADAVASKAAKVIAAEASTAISACGLVMSVSVGRSPWQKLNALAREPMPWGNVPLVQVDRSVAPAGHPIAT